MKFSVLISVYFKENPEFLSQSLISMWTQSIPPDEVVIVEDGILTDELYATLDLFEKEYACIKRVKCKTNQGLGKALQIGLQYCTFDIVARMDTDDISKPDRFEKLLSVFKMDKTIDVVGSWIDEFIDNKNNIISIRKVPEEHKEIMEFAKTRCPVNHPSVMFKKSAVISAGNYQPFPLFEDYYLWVRMLLNGSKFYNIQKSLLWFRTSKDTYKRRGGLKHALDEVRFQKFMFQSHFINIPTALKNVVIRFFVRIIPNDLRAIVYGKLLRR